MAETDNTGFEEISEMDSKEIFKPKIVSLVVSNSEDKGPNVMTAAWFMLAGYNPLRYQLAVDQHTYTHEIIEENKEFVLAAPSKDMVDALAFSGKVSGRDIDKIDYLGLETQPGSVVDVPILSDAVGNVECSVEESFEFEGTTYYFGTVERAHVRAGGMDGRLLSLDEDVLAYVGGDWAEDDEHLKSRYYAEVDSDDLRRFKGDDLLDGAPEDVREEMTD